MGVSVKRLLLIAVLMCVSRTVASAEINAINFRATSGVPMAELDFRGSRTFYSATCPPARGFWCLANRTTINVSVYDAPYDSTDILIWDWVGEVQ